MTESDERLLQPLRYIKITDALVLTVGRPTEFSRQPQVREVAS